MNIEVSISQTEIRFRHDGRPFTRKEILSLIYHGSTIPQAGDDLLGKFGTGFLSTHLLSRDGLSKALEGRHGTSSISFREPFRPAERR